MNLQTDPHGKDPHEKGAKLDAGKIRPGLVLGAFSRALTEVTKVGTFGAQKYTDNGWLEVPNGVERYTDAMLRHYLDEAQGVHTDPETGLLHAAHLAWNALARLELMLESAEICEILAESFDSDPWEDESTGDPHLDALVADRFATDVQVVDVQVVDSERFAELAGAPLTLAAASALRTVRSSAETGSVSRSAAESAVRAIRMPPAGFAPVTAEHEKWAAEVLSQVQSERQGEI